MFPTEGAAPPRRNKITGHADDEAVCEEERALEFRMANSQQSQAALLLLRQLRDLNKNPDSGFSAGLVNEENAFEWQVILTGPPDTP